MSIKPYLSKARNSVGKSDPFKAIKELETCIGKFNVIGIDLDTCNDIKNQLTILSSRLNLIEKESLVNPQYKFQSNGNLNSINMSILKLADQIEEIENSQIEILENDDENNEVLDSTSNPNNDTLVLEKKETIDIELIINKSYSNYSEKDQKKLLQALSKLLDMDEAEIKIKKKKPGSVKLTINLPKEKAEELFNILAEEESKLKNLNQELDVVEVNSNSLGKRVKLKKDSNLQKQTFTARENRRRRFESVYSKKVRAGKRRTYFFDVRRTKGDDFYLTLTESTKKFSEERYDRHKIFLYKEDFNRFLTALEDVVEHIKTELMPDYDYDEYTRRHEEFEAQREIEASNEVPYLEDDSYEENSYVEEEEEEEEDWSW